MIMDWLTQLDKRYKNYLLHTRKPKEFEEGAHPPNTELHSANFIPHSKNHAVLQNRIT